MIVEKETKIRMCQEKTGNLEREKADTDTVQDREICMCQVRRETWIERKCR
jgi:hypothetical protein